MSRGIKRMISAAASVAMLSLYSMPCVYTAGFFREDNTISSVFVLAPQKYVNTSLTAESPVLEREVFASDEWRSGSKSDAQALPSSFDLRKTGGAASIKNQAIYSTCWTFSAASGAETSLIGAVPDIDISEMHSALYANYIPDGNKISYDELEELLDMGGNTGKVLSMWSQWHGPVSDEKMPYDVDKITNMSGNELKMLMNSADYHMKNAYVFDRSDERSDMDDVNAQIKELVYSGHSVCASIYYQRDYYNRIYNTLCTDRSKSRANHSVSIIGWDDDYPAENFVFEPSGSGAWLVKNSWGTSYGEDGCFWLSYYDSALCDMTAFDITDNDDHDHNLYYDHSCSYSAYSASDSEAAVPSYMANVYKAENDMDITALATYIINPDTDYEVTVYTGLTDPADPSSGTPSDVTKGSYSLTGYFTIDLDEPVTVAEDEYFSVVVKLSCENSNYVLAAEETLSGYDSENDREYGVLDEISYDNIVKYSGSGQSFYSADGESWSDTTAESYILTDDEKQECLERIRDVLFDDIREDEEDELKAAEAAYEMYRERFEASDIKDVIGNNVLKVFGDTAGKVRFSHISGEVKSGEGVTLSADNGAEILCSVNGGDYEPYTGAIRITDDTVVSATTDRLNFYEKAYRPAKAQFNSILYRESYNGGIDALAAERISESSYLIELPEEYSEISLYAFTGADIAENEYNVSNSSFSDSISCGYGETKLLFHLSEAGKLDNDVEVTIFRKSVSIDLEDETISYMFGVTVYAPDGSELPDGSDVGQYAGQTLNGVNPDGEFTVKVPERAQLPELTIDYDNEVLGFIPNELAELLQYSVPGTFFVSADDRLVDGNKVSSGMAMNKAFRVIPGEELTLRTVAGNGLFAGDQVTYKIPEAPAAPAELPEMSWDPDTGLYSLTDPFKYEVHIVSEEQNDAADALRGPYTDREFDDVLMRRTGAADTETAYKWYSSERIGSSGLEAGKEYLIRYSAGNSAFASGYTEMRLNDKGDANENGIIEATDATMVLRHCAMIASGEEGIIADDAVSFVDMDGNGIITAVDASFILKLYADKQLN